jgi:hypothetical protein
LWPWLLGLTPKQVGFQRLLQTHFTLPGFPERVGDLAAALTDREDGSQPWAVCVEFQSEPDFDMPDRLMVVMALIRLTERPSEEVGDRYSVGAVVVNLTGKGSARREHHWRGAGLHVLVQPREWNFAEVPADLVMRQVADGLAPLEALAWIPLMLRGNDPGIIEQWPILARRETNRQRRADLGLALVFAELVGTDKLWARTLEGWNVRESPFLKQQEDRALAKGKAESLLQILQQRFKTVPDDLSTAILEVQDLGRLTSWINLAVSARTLRTFRKQAGV